MLREFIKTLHKSTKRKYLHRMLNEKAKCMKIAKNFSKSYWDGPKKYGYGGYKYIEGRGSKFALDLLAKKRKVRRKMQIFKIFILIFVNIKIIKS